MIIKKLCGIFCVVSYLSLSLCFSGSTEAKAAEVEEIPNTTRVVKEYDNSFLSVTGFASLGVNDRSKYWGTSYYRKVRTGREFLQAILDAGNGIVKVIEVVDDINLGWSELALSSEEAVTYSFITKYAEPTNGFTNPILEESGVSKLNVTNIDGLTIFSSKGKTIKHVELKLQASSNDIVIRNLNFDEMWQWDDTGKHKEVGWTFIKVNGANNVWIDHCKFSIASDGMIDLENGSSNVTLSWCEFGLAADVNPDPDCAIYQSIDYMEQKYAANELSDSSLYYKMRNAGATEKQIMAYAAYHSKCHLSGSGDKDYVNYVDSNGVEVKDGNQRIRLTMAYCSYKNVGQRLPMVRQGVGHVYNCYFDNSSHTKLLNDISAISDYGTDQLSRGMNARNGASIAADTCIYRDVTKPIIGAEVQGLDTGNMDSPWDELFQYAYNNNLIVNSKITNIYGTYIGSSWDNNGDNLFTKGFTWYNKSTIGNWVWSSSIVGSESMSKSNPPSTPFSFEYHDNEQLAYTYSTVPLEKVVTTVSKYAGINAVNLSRSEWLKTTYTSSRTQLDK